MYFWILGLIIFLRVGSVIPIQQENLPVFENSFSDLSWLSGIGDIKFNPAKQPAEVRLGLLIPAPPENEPLARSAWQGAELAIKMANEEGGFQGKPFRLIVRTADGLWGAGSKEAVKFVYEDEVSAIITALDGRNAHLAEQVATKSHVVQIATRATDETLSQAFVPWFFRIVPDDRQQAEKILQELSRNRISKIALMHADDYDQRMAAQTFKKKAFDRDIHIRTTHVYSSADPLKDASITEVNDEVEALVFFGLFRDARKIMDRVREKRADLAVYGSLAITLDGQVGREVSSGCEGGIFVSSKFCFTTPGQEFKKAFQESYGHIPDPAASYAFDGVKVIIQAIREAGPDREAIRDSLKEMRFAGGATGSIQFDKYGNRQSPVFMVRIIKGHPVILNH